MSNYIPFVKGNSYFGNPSGYIPFARENGLTSQGEEEENDDTSNIVGTGKAGYMVI